MPVVTLSQLLVFSFILLYVFVLLYCIMTTPSPINAVLYLIAFFFGISTLLIFCGADYLGVLFLLIYAGAISILLLFVVMLLDLKDISFVPRNQLPVARGLLFIVFALSLTVFLKTYLPVYGLSVPYYTDWFSLFSAKTNIEAVGLALYGYYNFQFMLLGFLLFITMIVIISMVVNHNYASKKQVLHEQLLRTTDLYFTEDLSEKDQRETN